MKGDYGFYVRDAFFKNTNLSISSIVLLSKLICIKVYSPSYVVYEKYLIDFLRKDVVKIDYILCELMSFEFLEDFTWVDKKLLFTINEKKVNEVCGCNVFKSYKNTKETEEEIGTNFIGYLNNNN